MFSDSAIPVDPTDTHYFEYGDWNGTGLKTLHIDHGSDGTLDETMEIKNYANQVYLPVILRGN